MNNVWFTVRDNIISIVNNTTNNSAPLNILNKVIMMKIIVEDITDSVSRMIDNSIDMRKINKNQFEFAWNNL